MTKQQYLKWLEKRGDAGTWDLADCRAADALIKRETLKRLDELLLERAKVPTTLAEYIKLMVDIHFGSMETDNLLMTYKLYPEWMEKPKS